MIHYMLRCVTLLLSVFAGGITLFLPVSGITQEKGVGGGQMAGLHEGIEQKATTAQADDASSIGALIDEVFNFPRAYPRMPSLMESAVKDRLVQAEISYRQGVKPGVHEQAVVKVVNDLATKFNAPPYAMTSVRQVRALRIGLSISEPRFMGTGTARQDAKIGESINPIMSPAQAVHLISTLIEQKLVNEEYQVPPAEWDQNLYNKSIERLQTAQEQTSAGTARTGQLVLGQNLKRKEMHNLLSRNISAISLNDAIDLVHQEFKTLGIE